MNFFWTRPWNRENIKTFEIYSYNKNKKNLEIGRDYLYQLYETVIDTIFNFTNYQNRDFIEYLINSKNLEIYVLFHDRVEIQKKFEGITISFGVKNRFGWDRVDLIFEDEVINGKVDNIVNSVRLYLSPYFRYIKKDFDMFYWDSSDKKSLEIFQNSFLDSIHFYNKVKNLKNTKINLLKSLFLTNIGKMKLPKNSFRN